MTRTTPGRELKALDAMNNLNLWLTRMTLGYELRVPDDMNDSRFEMT